MIELSLPMILDPQHVPEIGNFSLLQSAKVTHFEGLK